LLVLKKEQERTSEVHLVEFPANQGFNAAG
jgi:hypothetical protein